MKEAAEKNVLELVWMPIRKVVTLKWPQGMFFWKVGSIQCLHAPWWDPAGHPWHLGLGVSSGFPVSH